MRKIQITKKYIYFFIVLIIFMIVASLEVIPAEAAVDTVGNYSQLQQAILNAPTNGTEHIIQVSANINCTSYITYIPSGKNIVIRSVAGGTFMLIQTTSVLRHFVIYSSGSLTLENIILDGSSLTGGGVQVDGGSFVMNTGAVIQNCSNGNGGGVQVNSGKFIMNDGAVKDSKSTVSGGGLYMQGGSAEMNGGVISGNTSASTGGGAAYLLNATFEMNGGVMNNNTGASGGAVYLNTNSKFTMNDGTVKENKGISSGGAMYVSGTASLTMTGGLMTGNTSANGGCLYVLANGIFRMDGGEIYNNKSTGNGGGIFLSGGSVTMTDGKIRGNTGGTYGGGVHMNAGTLNMQGGIISGNTAVTYGAGVCVANAATFNMNGGIITDNTTNYGGGVCAWTGKFYFANGTISENKAKINGGGIFVNTGNTSAVISGGNVSENTAASFGGGIYADAETDISQGAITGNQAVNGGGIYVASNKNVKVTGVRITGNTATTGNGGGIYVPEANYANLSVDATTVFSGNRAGTGAYVYTGTGSYSATQRIPSIDFPVSTSISFIGTPYGDIFKLSKEYPLNNYDINYTQGTRFVFYTVTYHANGGSGTVSDTNIYGQNATATVLPETGLSYPGYHFIGWNTSSQGDGMTYDGGDTLSVTNNITLYAQWEKDIYTVSVNMDHPAKWEDIGQSVAVIFVSASLRQTAIFNPDILEYNGNPPAGSVNGITPLRAGSWDVVLHLPDHYGYTVYKNGTEVNKLTMTDSDIYNCQIEIKIYPKGTRPWGKQLYQSAG